ncbi:hypothetical protein ACVINW_001495 [Bradyrhizobium sp. USDA 4461]
MLSIAQIRRLVLYFDRIDSNLVQGLAEPVPADEREITRRLHRLLDERDSWSSEDDVLKEWQGSDLALRFAIEMRLHPTGWEDDVTYSDYGIVLSFEDEVLGRPPQTTAYLVQAKRLYDNPAGPRYDLRSSFDGGDEEQRIKHHYLAAQLGEDAVKFGAYCPRLPIFDPSAIKAILQLHQENASALYTGTPFGLELQRQVSDGAPDASDAGFWILPISPRLRRAVDLHRTAFLSNLPFGWFVVANLWMLATAGNVPPDPLYSVRIPHVIPWLDRRTPYGIGLNFGQSDEVRTLTVGLAKGDESAAEELVRRSEGTVPKSRFRPAATLEIRIIRAPAPDLHPRFDYGRDDDARSLRM